MIRISMAALAAGIAVSALCVTTVDAQTAPAPAMPERADLAEPADIVVTGTRAGERKAIEEKRKADNFVDAIYANDVVVVGDSPQRRLFRDFVSLAPLLAAPLIAVLQ